MTPSPRSTRRAPSSRNWRARDELHDPRRLTWMPEYLVSIDGGTCIGCGRCYKVCSRDVMHLHGVDDEGEVLGKVIEGEGRRLRRRAQPHDHDRRQRRRLHRLRRLRARSARRTARPRRRRQTSGLRRAALSRAQSRAQRLLHQQHRAVTRSPAWGRVSSVSLKPIASQKPRQGFRPRRPTSTGSPRSRARQRSRRSNAALPMPRPGRVRSPRASRRTGSMPADSP